MAPTADATKAMEEGRQIMPAPDHQVEEPSLAALARVGCISQAGRREWALRCVRLLWCLSCIAGYAILASFIPMWGLNLVVMVVTGCTLVALIVLYVAGYELEFKVVKDTDASPLEGAVAAAFDGKPLAVICCAPGATCPQAAPAGATGAGALCCAPVVTSYAAAAGAPSSSSAEDKCSSLRTPLLAPPAPEAGIPAAKPGAPMLVPCDAPLRNVERYV